MNKITLTLKKLNKTFLILGVSCFSLLGYSQNLTNSKNETYIPSEPGCIYRIGEFKGRVSIPRSQKIIDKMSRARSGPPCASISVNYTGFTTEAQTAFQFAVDIWAASIESSQVIRVDASFIPLTENTLGQAGTTSVTTLNPSTVPGALPNVFYPIALAEKLLATNINDLEPEIVAEFNSDFEDWYYGLDANPPANQIDFVSVVLHELAHGIGFIGISEVSDLNGSIRLFGDPPKPTIYSTFIENGSEIEILSFDDPSTDLKNELEGNDLFCNSATAKEQLGNILPEIWAPFPYESGSSYSHWDEDVFASGDINSLMSPQIARGEANHNPGPITLGFLKDMGWSLCEGSLTVEDFSLETVEVSPNPFTSSITIKVTNGLSDDYNLNLFDINGRIVLSETKAVLNGTMTISNLDQLDDALYFIKITNVRSGVSITKKVIKK